MRVVTLSLRNFRNYERLDLELAPGLNVVIGANGQGKTNLLESLALLALSASPRAQREAELIGPWGGEASIEAEVESGGRVRRIAIRIARMESRTIRRIEVDGLARRAVDLPGALRVTLFWPEDLNLVKAGPEYRRRLLNQLLVQIRPGYASHLARYTRALEQRNRLLKRIAVGEARWEELDAWDEVLGESGDQIAQARSAVARRLAELAAANLIRISREVMKVTYIGGDEALGRALAACRLEDVARGTTTRGPHRDDLQIILDERQARLYASQGQQRSVVVSLKLAEAALVREVCGEPSVLLLDDVLSELDDSRRAALMQMLSLPGQALVTTVDAEAFSGRASSAARFLRVVAGRVASVA